MPKPVLSNYPVSQDNMGSDAVPRICNASWMDSGLYRMDAAHDTWPKCAPALHRMSISGSQKGARESGGERPGGQHWDVGWTSG